MRFIEQIRDAAIQSPDIIAPEKYNCRAFTPAIMEMLHEKIVHIVARSFVPCRLCPTSE